MGQGKTVPHWAGVGKDRPEHTFVEEKFVRQLKGRSTVDQRIQRSYQPVDFVDATIDVLVKQ